MSFCSWSDFAWDCSRDGTHAGRLIIYYYYYQDHMIIDELYVSIIIIIIMASWDDTEWKWREDPMLLIYFSGAY